MAAFVVMLSKCGARRRTFFGDERADLIEVGLHVAVT
jgi:hypothetical protein